MKLKHRLAYYLFGLTMGGFFVVFIFNKRGQDFCYLPNCRVLKDLRTKGLVMSKEAQAKLDAKWVTKDDLQKSLEHGDVDFSQSNKPAEGGGKLYVVEGRTAKDEAIILEVVNYTDKAVLRDIKKQ